MKLEIKASFLSIDNRLRSFLCLVLWNTKYEIYSKQFVPDTGKPVVVKYKHAESTKACPRRPSLKRHLLPNTLTRYEP